ncbi:MAG: methyl-accepting chemotaxis sensory transducer [Firmicutes bacterium]|nr:methyl-accepting chemotaxis sensory transducer [Bacillota bacterium]
MLTKAKRIMGITLKSKFFSFVDKIQFKLILAFMIPILCIIALGIISYNKAYHVIVSNYETSMMQTLDMTGQYYTFSLGAVESDLSEIYQSVPLRDYFKGVYSVSPTEELRIYNTIRDGSMKDKTNADPLIEDMYILTDDKSFLTTKAKDDRLYTYYTQTDQGKAVLTDDNTYHWFGANSDMDETLDCDSNVYALRLARHLKKTNAILIADINRDAIMSILNRLDMGEGSYLALVTWDGVEIQPEKKDSNEKIGHNIFYGQNYFQKALSSEKTTFSEYVELNNESYLFISNKIGETGLVVCTLIPKENIISQVSKIKSITLLIVLFACAISVVICSLIAGGIGSTIRYMKKQLDRVSKGDLTVEIKSKRRDEFASLAQDITNMILSMKELILKVNEVGKELVLTIDFLANTSKTFVGTTNNIRSAVGEIEAGIIQLDENSEDCLGQMLTLSDKISLVHENTNRISEITNSTGQAISIGIQTMDDLNTKAKDTTLITNRVIDTIKLLETKTKKIGNIVGVMNEISGQTNLLSLNASIESARVGAAGRGFAVIASEIRNLSDSSLKSSNQIQNIINEIVQNINEVVETAKEAEVIVQLQKVAVNNTSQSFNLMDRQIEEMITETKEIKENVKNMEQARMTTEEAIQSISAVSEETTACSDTVNTTVNDQLNTVSQVDDTIHKLLKDAEILEEAINRFVIM